MSIGFREVFGLGLVVMLALSIAVRVLMILFWRRMKHVNPNLWQARRQRQSWTTPISKLQLGWTLTVLFFWKKSGWETTYGSLDDVVLDRLASAGKRTAIAFFTLWLSLMVLLAAETASRALSSF